MRADWVVIATKTIPYGFVPAVLNPKHTLSSLIDDDDAASEAADNLSDVRERKTERHRDRDTGHGQRQTETDRKAETKTQR